MLDLPKLTVPKQEAKKKITAQIDEGYKIKNPDNSQ